SGNRRVAAFSRRADALDGCAHCPHRFGRAAILVLTIRARRLVRLYESCQWDMPKPFFSGSDIAVGRHLTLAAHRFPGGGIAFAAPGNLFDQTGEIMPAIRMIAAVAALVAATAPAATQNWPTRPVTMVVTFAAG